MRPRGRLRVFRAPLGTLLWLALGQAVPALAVRIFAGGTKRTDAAAMVAKNRTVYPARIVATVGSAADTACYVKLRST